MFEEILQKGKKRAFSARPRDAPVNTTPRCFPGHPSRASPSERRIDMQL